VIGAVFMSKAEEVFDIVRLLEARVEGRKDLGRILSNAVDRLQAAFDDRDMTIILREMDFLRELAGIISE